MSIIGKERLAELGRYLKECQHLDGDIAELGVYKGGSAKLIASIERYKTIHLFDTFTGMPEPSEHDTHKAGDFSDTSLETVREYLRGHNNVLFHPGRFPETAIGDKFCFVHADGDLYETTKAAIEYFYPRLTGVILFDDYGFDTTKGCKKAIEECGLPFEVLPTKQAIIRAASGLLATKKNPAQVSTLEPGS